MSHSRNRFFTADTHFGHSNIIDYCSRPFSSVEEMDEAIIKNWNKVVADHDEVWLLGDIFISQVNQNRAMMDAYLGRLKGELYLVVGNHDKHPCRRHPRWKGVFEGVFLGKRFGHPSLWLTHNPEVRAEIAEVHLHGHRHGQLLPSLNRCDVGVDVFGFKPVRWEDIDDFIKIWTETE